VGIIREIFVLNGEVSLGFLEKHVHSGTTLQPFKCPLKQTYLGLLWRFVASEAGLGTPS
jgi:hypothetical protein